MSTESGSLFGKKNYGWMLGGLALIALGMFLMSGGQSNTDPTVFNKVIEWITQHRRVVWIDQSI